MPDKAQHPEAVEAAEAVSLAIMNGKISPPREKAVEQFARIIDSNMAPAKAKAVEDGYKEGHDAGVAFGVKPGGKSQSGCRNCDWLASAARAALSTTPGGGG